MKKNPLRQPGNQKSSNPTPKQVVSPTPSNMNLVNGFPGLAGTPAPKRAIGGTRKPAKAEQNIQLRTEKKQKPAHQVPGKVDSGRGPQLSGGKKASKLSGSARTNGNNY